MSTLLHAAANLLGIELDSGWKIIEHKKKNPSLTGGFFSESYIVEKEGNKAFLKALDIAAFFQLKGGFNIVDVMREMTTAFQFERDLLEKTKEHRLSHIVTFYESGIIHVPGNFFIREVPYLIFELAETDVRREIEFSKSIDLTWKLNSLHNVAVAIMQLHSKNIGHQDIKPSNVFCFSNKTFKIGDLGRSVSEEIVAPHDDSTFSGDKTYAPPEVFYGYFIQDWHQRVFSIDTYMLGSLITFFFLGTNMTALLKGKLDDSFSWVKWRGEFAEVVPYLEEAFQRCLNSLENAIEDEELRKEIRFLVECLCQPDPKKRGHPRTILTNHPNQYDLVRIVQKLSILKLKAEYKLIKLSKGDVSIT